MNADATLACDVAVVGGGLAGAHTALGLAEKGVGVVILEAGDSYTRAELVRTFFANPTKGPQSAYPADTSFAPFPADDRYDEYYIRLPGSSHEFVGAHLRLVGGTSWHWTGFAERLRPADFEMKTRYGVGCDWPITYYDLEPYYDRAEREWGVSGDRDYTWGAPRTTDYPMPSIPPTYLDQVVDGALRQLDLSSKPFSHGRNSIPYDGRPICCGSNTCVPICPIAAKYDASVHVEKAVRAGARLIKRARVDHIVIGQDKQVVALVARRPDSSVLRVTARHYVVCCHAIETTRLLLNSKQETAPDGVANFEGNVGRYLMSQANQDTLGLTRDPVFPYRGPQQTSGIVEFRDGDFRRERAAVGTSFMNSGWSGNMDATKLAAKLIGDGLKGPALIGKLKADLSRHLRLNSSAEILPDRDNRVTLDEKQPDSVGVPRPAIRFVMDDYARRGLAAALEVNRTIFQLLGASQVDHSEPYLSNAIIAGTARMGLNSKTSVVGPNLRTHDHPNLYIVGSSTHVTAPINPPSMTITALAYRLADFLSAQFAEASPPS